MSFFYFSICKLIQLNHIKGIKGHIFITIIDAEYTYTPRFAQAKFSPKLKINSRRANIQNVTILQFHIIVYFTIKRFYPGVDQFE